MAAAPRHPAPRAAAALLALAALLAFAPPRGAAAARALLQDAGGGDPGPQPPAQPAALPQGGAEPAAEVMGICLFGLFCSADVVRGETITGTVVAEGRAQAEVTCPRRKAVQNCYCESSDLVVSAFIPARTADATGGLFSKKKANKCICIFRRGRARGLSGAHVVNPFPRDVSDTRAASALCK
ncbi:MAG: hypothetical protein J3K34DRAFT_521538 [Monoraphidium minutum]|nr:MAG: hypothetical protein J3K34DRAFT_521538 [Monoraphidium minutum]